MSSFEEKIVDKLWDGVEPSVNLSRIFSLLALLVIFSPEINLFFSIETYFLPLSKFISLVGNIYSSNPTWKLLLSVLWVFIIGPLITSWITRYYISKFHIKYCDPLLQRMHTLKNDPDSYSPNRLQEFLNDQIVGQAKLEKYKNYLEIYTNFCSVVAMVLAIENFLYGIGIVAVWLLGAFWVSQKMLILIINEIQPFNFLKLERSNRKLV